MEIHITKIIKKDNTISYIYQQTGMDSIFNNETPFYEYDQNIESVPDSIAVIPFICNILPIIFVYDATLYVDEIDSVFLKSISKYRRGYKRLIPDLNFKGRVVAKRIRTNNYETTKNCLLFSGGLDAFNTLCMNERKINDCIAVWGPEINIEDNKEWNKLYKSINEDLSKFHKKSHYVRTNFQRYFNYYTLEEKVKNIGDYWWHGLQHGIAFLGLTAPLAYLNGYKHIYIASSFTKKYHLICASDPYTDNCFKFGKSSAIHDGFEFDRCQKVLNVYNACVKKSISLNIHVCYNVDNKRLGIISTIDMNLIKNQVSSYDFNNKYLVSRYQPIVEAMNKTYKTIPEDLKWLNDLHFQKDKLNFRKLVKKVFPYNTFRGKIVRKIYNTIKK